ncbi:MAG: hypothetical protein KBF56_02360 [Gemmatimonadaceae bacterium]|nr:hypothetical protein [Gemmatimonadaceae bacterium]
MTDPTKTEAETEPKSDEATNADAESEPTEGELDEKNLDGVAGGGIAPFG